MPQINVEHLVCCLHRSLQNTRYMILRILYTGIRQGTHSSTHHTDRYYEYYCILPFLYYLYEYAYIISVSLQSPESSVTCSSYAAMATTAAAVVCCAAAAAVFLPIDPTVQIR